MSCPCGSGSTYEECCGRYHGGEIAPTAEALMRSRYCAFVKGDIAYLKQTTWPPHQKHFDETGYAARANESIWTGLEIHETTQGQAADTKGTVTFTARSLVAAQMSAQTEKSLFKKKSGHWYYVKAL